MKRPEKVLPSIFRKCGKEGGNRFRETERARKRGWRDRRTSKMYLCGYASTQLFLGDIGN